MKPNKFLITLIFIWVANLVSAQNMVLFHNGIIKREDHSVIKDGMTISETEKLFYDSPKDAIWVYIPQKGEFKITPSPSAEKKENAFVEAVLSSIHLQVKEGDLFGKPGPPIIGEDLTPDSRYTQNLVLLLQDVNPFRFDAVKFHNGSFFLQVAPKNGTPNTMPLKVNKDTVFIKAEDFKFTNENATYTIGYFGSKQLQLETEIYPSLDPNGKMAAMIGFCISALSKQYTSRDSVYAHSYGLVYHALGLPCKINFDRSFNAQYQKLNPPKK